MEVKHIFLVFYIVDILLNINEIDLSHDTKRFLSRNFEIIYLGDTFFMLGIQKHQDYFSRHSKIITKNLYL